MDANDLFSLEGRNAIVTGGSRGIGRMIANGFISAGAKVYISSRNSDACDSTAAELGPNCISLPQDLSSPDGCQALARAFGKREDHLDILVNNAGAAWMEPFASFPEKGWDKIIDVNLKSPFFLTQALHSLLQLAASPGRPAKVINIASIDGLRLNSWETYSYASSKAALIHLTRNLAARLIKDDIVVTAIAPGAFPSEMNRTARDHGDTIATKIPAKRIGDADDMAGAAIYLASKAGNYVVGSTLVVDGGVYFATLDDNTDA